jgi:hypothetical protein
MIIASVLVPYSDLRSLMRMAATCGWLCTMMRSSLVWRTLWALKFGDTNMNHYSKKVNYQYGRRIWRYGDNNEVQRSIYAYGNGDRYRYGGRHWYSPGVDNDINGNDMYSFYHHLQTHNVWDEEFEDPAIDNSIDDDGMPSFHYFLSLHTATTTTTTASSLVATKYQHQPNGTRDGSAISLTIQPSPLLSSSSSAAAAAATLQLRGTMIDNEYDHMLDMCLLPSWPICMHHNHNDDIDRYDNASMTLYVSRIRSYLHDLCRVDTWPHYSYWKLHQTISQVIYLPFLLSFTSSLHPTIV